MTVDHETLARAVRLYGALMVLRAAPLNELPLLFACRRCKAAPFAACAGPRLHAPRQDRAIAAFNSVGETMSAEMIAYSSPRAAWSTLAKSTLARAAAAAPDSNAPVGVACMWVKEELRRGVAPAQRPSDRMASR